jgi:4-hydroxybenzoate polyprenyltransferase
LFALVAAPAPDLYRWLLGVWWLFINLFHLNVSNQYKSGDEDRMNHSWRPIPAGRITTRNATILRWALLPISFLASVPFGWDVAACNIGLFVTFYFYDNMKGSHHWLIKSACNIPGYGLLEYGATKVMGTSQYLTKHGGTFQAKAYSIAGGPLDQTGIMSILCSITVVFTTIQTADFADVVGDKAVGRLTMPIHFPEFSRIVTFAGLVAWSTYLASLWQLGLYSALVFVVWGSWIGFRFYHDRTQKADTFSYVLYNVSRPSRIYSVSSKVLRLL